MFLQCHACVERGISVCMLTLCTHVHIHVCYAMLCTRSAIRVFKEAVEQGQGSGMVSETDLATITEGDFQVRTVFYDVMHT